jgi:hypothetical protein
MTDATLHTHQAHHALALVMGGCRLPDVVAVLVAVHGMERDAAEVEALEAAEFAMTHYGVMGNELARL